MFFFNSYILMIILPVLFLTLCMVPPSPPPPHSPHYYPFLTKLASCFSIVFFFKKTFLNNQYLDLFFYCCFLTHLFGLILKVMLNYWVHKYLYMLYLHFEFYLWSYKVSFFCSLPNVFWSKFYLSVISLLSFYSRLPGITLFILYF